MQQFRSVVRRLHPAAVLSVGGYAAGPAALACVSQGVPLAILEPNSTLGLANRLLAPFAKRAYVAWFETGRLFRGDKARRYGVPLRPGFEPRAYAPPGSEPKRLLVLGGSQGAQALNDVLPRAVARAARDLGDTSSLAVVHQVGRERDASVRQAYEAAGFNDVEVVPFIDDVALRMTAADVVVARAGAVTVAEISAIGRASILVPFPHAADDHQAKNALALSAIGGAVCVRQEVADEARLATEIASLLSDDTRRVRMADAAREHGRPRAAEDVAKDLLELAGIPAKKHDEPSKKNGAANGSSLKFHHIIIDRGPERGGLS
jgi:UDP-N-acetylglucosamine--N-acetylmuramyl-(pentapeptide) pyrophosphoryl-undecaprenol N-acetylglucosamine transferase